MALPRRQRRLLKAIDRQTSAADPRLAWLFGIFGQLWAGEPLPAREQLNTRATRFRSGLWEALAAGAWPAPPFTGPSPSRARGVPDGSANSRQADRRPGGSGS